jgi:tetratricopeptide (TPR) repeat protein
VDKAESCFSKAVQLNPSSTDALNNLGNIRKERGQFADAEYFYRKALALDPATPATWKNLGQVLQQCQRFDDAMECYQKALDLRPTDAIALVDIGTIHLLQGGSLRPNMISGSPCSSMAIWSRPCAIWAMY